MRAFCLWLVCAVAGTGQQTAGKRSNGSVGQVAVHVSAQRIVLVG